MKTLKGDFFGALTASLVALPICMALGMAAFAPLGKEYVPMGVLAGLFALMLGPLMCALFGGRSPQIVCPTAPMSVMIATLATDLLKEFSSTSQVLLFIAAAIVCSGLFQIALGLCRGGKLIKYIPYPVVAGFMNGIALIFLIHQIHPILGVANEKSYASILQGGIHYGALIAGVVTIATSFISERFTHRIPGDLIGLIIGTATFFAFAYFFDPSLLRLEQNSLIIGPIPNAIPTPKRLFDFLHSASSIPMGTWTYIAIPALTMGFIASLESLLATLIIDKRTKSRHDSNLGLIGQGIGNIASGFCGGMAVATALPETMVNLNNGGRTNISGITLSVIVTLIVVALRPYAEWIPVSVLAGLLVVTSCKLFEYESFQLIKRKATLMNMFIVLVVTLVTVSVDLIYAVGIGLVIAAFLFVKEQMSQTLIRRKFSGDHFHSKSVRDEEAMHFLEKKGGLISIYELSGSLFFGSCDKLLLEIEKDVKSLCLIFDFKRVTSIDITGAQLLLQIIERIHSEGRKLLFSNLEPLRKYMEDVKIVEAVGSDQIFPDMDMALDWAEEYLLEKEAIAAPQKFLKLKDLMVFSKLTEEQLQRVQKYLSPRHYKKGEIVFRQGDPGDGIYFILTGYVSVIEETTGRRLATFDEGVFFGDMGLLEDKPRSATVTAQTNTELLFMSKKNFHKLTIEEPQIAIELLLKISHELANRLRRTNDEVSFLIK